MERDPKKTPLVGDKFETARRAIITVSRISTESVSYDILFSNGIKRHHCDQREKFLEKVAGYTVI
mgnify:CR=1 FL=1